MMCYDGNFGHLSIVCDIAYACVGRWRVNFEFGSFHWHLWPSMGSTLTVNDGSLSAKDFYRAWWCCYRFFVFITINSNSIHLIICKKTESVHKTLACRRSLKLVTCLYCATYRATINWTICNERWWRSNFVCFMDDAYMHLHTFESHHLLPSFHIIWNKHHREWQSEVIKNDSQRIAAMRCSFHSSLIFGSWE